LILLYYNNTGTQHSLLKHVVETQTLQKFMATKSLFNQCPANFIQGAAKPTPMITLSQKVALYSCKH